MEMVRFAVAVIFVLCSISFSDAATTPPSGGAGAGDAHSMPCIQKLMPCQPYLHSATPPPPASCCMPLKEIVETDVNCLCSVFNNVDMLRSLNLTKENALVLPKACGANADVSQCKSSTATASSAWYKGRHCEGTTTPSTSPGTTKTPPASPAESGSTGGSASSTAKPSDSAPAPINFAGISVASAFVALATIFF